VITFPEVTVARITEQNFFVFLVQLFLLLGLSKLLGILFSKWKLQAMIAPILVGVVLGPTVLGRLLPSVQNALFPKVPAQYEMIDTVAWLGFLLLLLVDGLEVNFSNVLKRKSGAGRVSIADFVIPIALTGIPCYFIAGRYADPGADRILATLFVASTMTLSAMPVAIRAMRDTRILKTDMGYMASSALTINEVVGWLVFTAILGVFSRGGVSFGSVLLVVAATAAFTAFALTVGRRFFDLAMGAVKKKTEDSAAVSLTLVLMFGLAFGAVTNAIGIHVLLGFFLAGLVAGEAKELSESSRSTISQVVHAVFVPIFFATMGLRVDIVSGARLGLTAFVLVLGILARLLAAYAGALFTRTERSNRHIIAVLHTPGGEMQVVVGVLALELGLIGEPLFIAVVGSAVLSSVLFGPWLSSVVRVRDRLSIAQFLSPSGIIAQLKTATREQAISALCAQAAALSGVNYHLVLESVRAREEVMSTALEKEIAVPHAKISDLQSPLIVFGREPAGIDWNAMDGKPVKLIFLILTPSESYDIQLRIYRGVIRMLQQEDFRQKLIDAPDHKAIWGIISSAVI
jgi:Kef-type K+ transport system membrane component KefB